MEDDQTPPDWVALQRYYETMARIPLADPAQKAEVAADARRTLRVLEHFPDQPPPEMRALLERMARGGA
jgi:hypothetical protein